MKMPSRDSGRPQAEAKKSSDVTIDLPPPHSGGKFCSCRPARKTSVAMIANGKEGKARPWVQVGRRHPPAIWFSPIFLPLTSALYSRRYLSTPPLYAEVLPHGQQEPRRDRFQVQVGQRHRPERDP